MLTFLSRITNTDCIDKGVVRIHKRILHHEPMQIKLIPAKYKLLPTSLAKKVNSKQVKQI